MARMLKLLDREFRTNVFNIKRSQRDTTESMQQQTGI
jgi:hypothetical protein